MQIEIVDRRSVTEAEARPIAELLIKTFPRRDFAERLSRYINEWQNYDGPEEMYPRAMLIRAGDRVIAHAAVAPRTIHAHDGAQTVAGLSLVATDPAERGRNLGQAVVRAVFDLVDHGPFHDALFQTTPPVRSFYEKLGAGAVDNRFFNSLADDPLQSPFVDGVVMHYPAVNPWPKGDIDLRGPGW